MKKIGIAVALLLVSIGSVNAGQETLQEVKEAQVMAHYKGLIEKDCEKHQGVKSIRRDPNPRKGVLGIIVTCNDSDDSGFYVEVRLSDIVEDKGNAGQAGNLNNRK